jgi:hypothetical protein
MKSSNLWSNAMTNAKTQKAAAITETPTNPAPDNAPVPVPVPAAPTVPAHGDGFDCAGDVGGKSIIKGVKLSFGNDAKWYASAAVVAPVEKDQPAREFIPIERIRIVQKWGVEPGPPLETRILADDAFFPDVERMNEEAPKSERRMAFGKEVGPYEKAHVLYLLEPSSMAGFTYIASTDGGFRAVSELMDAIKRARLLGDQYLFPVVHLTDTHMPTQYGGRQRPQFKIVRWVPIGRPLEKPALTTTTSKPANADMGGDAILF